MRAFVPQEVAAVVSPFAGRYTVSQNTNLCTVYPTSRRVVFDPSLAQYLLKPEDVALWVIAARNLLFVRSVLGSVSATKNQRMWEVAWTLAWAAKAYNLPFDSCRKFFNKDDPSIIRRVLTLAWLDGPMDSFAVALRGAVNNYHDWMKLGSSLGVDTWDPVGHDMLLGADADSFTLPPEERVAHTLYKLPIPRIDTDEVLWALSSMPKSLVDSYRNIPDAATITAFLNIPTQSTYLDSYLQIGHIGRREAVFIGAGIYQPYGRVHGNDDRVVPTYRVYMDVSRSVAAYTSLAWSMLRSLPGNAELFVFSGSVYAARPDDDFVYTDHSTDYDALATHILANPVDHAIIVSDDGDSLDPTLGDAVRAATSVLYVHIPSAVDAVFQPDCTFRSIASHVIDLPSS